MRLDSVQIVGFKSFCDRQEVSFRGGVTGIVGPNGCGKSNISDAISWVLGEQSAKSLRGSSMEDVIFNGSQARQPLQMAEVNLKVTGIQVTDPDASSEATVSRRLYRSGESEYLMNGQICRLRDVHELFMDTGLGAKAYSIIEQGKIGLILSSRPTDRRALIEEAAGITKYKARRKQTQVKLEAAQQNLLRVNDIVHEVEKQLESLKRQAGKARRYRAAREELGAVDRVLFGLRHIALVAQAEILAARVAAESEREQASGLALQTEETRIEARRHDLHEAEVRLEEVRARLGELTLGVDRHQGRSGYARQQISETETRAAEASREHAELSSRVGPLALSLTERQTEAVELAEEQRTVEAEARAVESLVSEAAGRQTATERDQEKAREVQVAVLGRIATLQNARASAAGSAERAAADLLKLAGESDELGRERARVDATRTTAEERKTASEALREELTTARERATELGAAARTRADALSREAKAVETERDGLAGRLASLEEMVSNHAAFDEGVRVLLAERESLGVLGVVADALETDPEHERVVEAFLGDRLQAVLVPDAETALQAVRWLHEHDAGRAAFLPLAQARTRSACGPLAQIAREEARVTGLLSEVYRVSGPHADRIRAALPDALVVRNLEDALALTEKWGPVACATLAGETVRGGMVEGGRDVPGILAPKRQMREVSQQKDRLDSRVALVREHEAEEAATAAAATEEARELSARIHAAEKELVAVGHILSATAEEKLRIDRKATVLETEHRQAEQEREAASLRLAEIETLLGTAEAERSEAALHLSALASAVADARSEAEASQARLSAARSRFAALRERLMAAEADCRRLARDREELEERIAATEARGAEMATRKEQLATELAQSERALAEALTDRDRVASDTAVAEDRVREIRTELEATEASMKDRRRERDLLKDALAELEISRARNGADLDHLARECHQAAGVTAAAAATSLSEEEKARDTGSLDEQAREIRERIERMGAVNVLAVEQAQEYEERHVFLTAQRQDLLDSIAEMDQAIRKIDRASRERFREAFQVINQYFGEIFRQLFGGGTAGLSLLDEEDILESGIDVMAQPPGKRLQNVMLLSGGEKAMTAIALLFAIFQYKPSPFCILDEVDAPLDDANIGRFVKMLEGMKDRTQFVIITHSRKTMEIADQLYGVTMEEPGVSKLVSVRFN